MITGLSLIVFLFLIVFSIIDLKTKVVPSFITTAVIFLICLVNFSDLEFGLIHMSFGLMTFIFAYMIYEMDFIRGVADIKVLVILGMMVKTIPSLFILLSIVVIGGFLYKVIWKYGLGKEENEEIPFLLCFLIIYCFMAVVGGLII